MESEHSQFLDRLAAIVFYGGLLLGSAVLIPLPALGFVLPKVAVLGWTAAIVSFVLLLNGRGRTLTGLCTSSPGLCILVFSVVLVLSLAWSLAPIVSFFGAPPRFSGLLTHFSALTLGLSAFLLASTPRGLRAVIQAIIGSGALVTLYGFTQWLELDPLRSAWEGELFLGRIFSTLGQPNFLGSFLLLTLPFVVRDALQASGYRRLCLTFLALLALVTLLATASRAALLGLIVAATFVTVIGWSRIRSAVLTYRYAIAAILFILLILGVEAFRSRFSVATQDTLLGSRAVLWKAALQMIAARPQGYGVETLALVTPQFLPKELYLHESLTTVIDRVHSAPLDLLVTLGPLGLLSVLGLLVMFSVHLWQRRSMGDRTLLLAGVSALVGYGVSILPGFSTPLTLAFAWIIVSLLLGITSRDREPRCSTIGNVILSLFCTGSLIAALVSTLWISARYSMNEAQNAFHRGDLVASVQRYAGAVERFPWDRSLLIEAAETTLLTRERSDDAATVTVLDRTIANLLLQLESITDGREGLALLLRAWHAALQGSTDDAEAALTSARDRMPNAIVTYRLSAKTYAILGNVQKEREMLQALRALLPPFWEDAESPRGRILWKEHPWLSDFLP